MMWDKEKDQGCRCGGMCAMCHAGAPKTKEEKIALLEKKEAKLKKILEHIQKVKEAVNSGKKMEGGEGDE